MERYIQMFEKNKLWVEQRKASNEDFFKHLAEGQNPEFLYIGCSDSRVTAEEMTGARPGQMFVHRNIANVISNNDLSAMSVIEYAVSFLKVRHIIVCGHYYCGGVKSAMEHKDYGILNPWLRNIRDVYRLHQKELDAMLDLDERYRRLVEVNVLEQCINVTKTAAVQKRFLADGFPMVHGWVFDVKSGLLIDLNFKFEENLKHIREIYDLGTVTQ
jgi:carbonic anhydrase